MPQLAGPAPLDSQICLLVVTLAPGPSPRIGLLHRIGFACIFLYCEVHTK